MTISPVYPIILQNGTTADANQVMANFYAIQSDVNANAAHNGANSDITSISGLTTPLSITQGGTGATNAPDARDNLGITPFFAALIPIGGGLTWTAGEATIPSNFLWENGQAVSRTTYAALFALYSAIGLPYGVGDGTTTFNLANTQGQFERGFDGSGSVDPGRTLGSLQGDQFQTHGHATTENPHTHTYDKTTSGNAAAGSPNLPAQIYTSTPSGGAVTGLTVDAPNSGNTGSETRPKNIARIHIVRVI